MYFLVRTSVFSLTNLLNKPLCITGIIKRYKSIPEIQKKTLMWGKSCQSFRAETKALIGGGGGCIFIYSGSARRISFEINGNDN